MIINAHVNQADVTHLKVDMQVNVEIEAVPGLIVEGVVERISPQATIVHGIKGFSARVILNNVDPRIVPGMTANIKIPVASKANVRAVPLAAIYSEDGERYVYIKLGETFEKRDVVIGLSDYFYAEVLDGLSGEERVAIEPPPADKIVEPESDSSASTASAGRSLSSL